MAGKKLWLGMLVMILAFGMMVVGCEEKPEVDTNPSPPTGLTGTVIPPNNSIRLTWNSVNNAKEYRIEYKKTTLSDGFYRTEYGITSTSYTFTDLDYETNYDFCIAVQNTDGFVGNFSSPIIVETGSPLTAKVSLSMETTCSYIDSKYLYQVVLKLTLPDGCRWNANDITGDLFKSWVTMSGTPNLSTWSSGTYDYGFYPYPQTVGFLYIYVSDLDNVSISYLMATINSSKLTEMKGYTNVVNSLTVGSPSFASSSTWERK